MAAGTWAPLVGPERYDSEELRRTGHELLSSSFLDSLGAGIASDLADYSPMGALFRMGEMSDALGQTPRVYGKGAIMPAPKRTPVTAEDWKGSPDYRPGLTYFDGMTSEAAKLLAERFDTRERRTDTMNRDPSGAVLTGVQYAARFAAQMADPINVASAFIPVVGEVRAARLAAQLGKFGGRAVTGAIEGTVGAALLEPLIYSAAKQDQLDYSMADSLANVGMGGLFGGALHAGFGAIGDVIRARGPQTHVAAMDTALVQAAAGREIDVAPVLRAADGLGERRNELGGNAAENNISVDRLGEATPQGRDTPGRSASADLLAKDRETIRKGREGDMLRPQKPDDMRRQALADLEAEFPSRQITLPSGGKVTRKGPMDLVTFLRAIGGIAPDAGGEIKAIDAHLYNKSRELPFAKGEQFLGRLVHDRGLPLEVAAERARDAGFLGDRQTSTNEYGEVSHGWTGGPAELIAALDKNLRATGVTDRVWGPDVQDRIDEYASTMRAIDDQEHFGQREPEDWIDLDNDPDADSGEAFDADHAAELEGTDDPEALWQDAEERLAASEGRKPGTGIEPKPTPEQELAQLTQRIDQGMQAAAACIARAL
jgi:hypothetical protein